VPPKTDAVTIRDARPADATALGVLGAELVRVHHGFDPLRFLEPRAGTAEGYGNFLRSQLGDPATVVLVAEHDGVLVGYAYAGFEDVDYMSLRGPAGVLHDVVVTPAKRGTGIGRRLVEAVLARLAAGGAPRVVLSTAERNAAAQALFAALGFRRTMVEMTRELGA